MGYESLIGGGIGAGIGAIGGYFQAQAADEAARDLRKKIRQGTLAGQADTVRQVAGTLGSAEYQTADNFIRGLYGLGPVSGEELYNRLLGEYGGAAASFGQDIHGGYDPQSVRNRDYVQQTLLGAVGPDLMKKGIGTNDAGYAYQSGDPYGLGAGTYARDIVTSRNRMQRFDTAFQNAANPLLQNFSKSIQQTLAARGLNAGMSAAGVEASGLAAYQTQLQLQQIPALLNLASAPSQYRQQFEGGNLARGVFSATGGQAVYGQASPAAMDRGPMVGLTGALSGAAAGFGAGASLGTNIGAANQLYDYLHPARKKTPGLGLEGWGMQAPEAGLPVNQLVF